jgi:polysaccharide biosynthesis/export protein
MRLLLLFAVVSSILSSCVTNKKYVYLQKNDVNKKDLPKDTVIRAYDQTPFDYRVQPNDALYVNIKSITKAEYDFLHAEGQATNAAGGQGFLINSELVDPGGNISFPVIGKVAVGGKTVFEIQELLQNLANQYLESAIVKVRLVNFRFTVIGEVTVEGTITTLNNRVSLPEAIGLAGGISDLADKANIKIVRQIDGQTQVAYVNLLDENLLSSPYYFVNQSDLIIVPALRQRPYRKYFAQNLGLVITSLTLLLTVINLSN